MTRVKEESRSPVYCFAIHMSVVQHLSLRIVQSTDRRLGLRQNPFGRVYSREGLISLAKFAAQENLHLVVDEIYARSIFVSPDLPAAPDFESILSIDVEKEASLPRSSVHVVSSASKDFGVNGFRLGIYINQGNQKVVEAMTSLGILSQASSPAAALFSTWLEDTDFLRWYFEENHRRMTHAYTYLTQWARHHQIPYVPANSGHFVMLDFRRFLPPKDEARAAEAALSQRLLEAGIFIAPGGQYHHPDPGVSFSKFSQSCRSADSSMCAVVPLHLLHQRRGCSRGSETYGTSTFAPESCFVAGRDRLLCRDPPLSGSCLRYVRRTSRARRA